MLVQDTNFSNHTIPEQTSNVQASNYFIAFTAFNLRHLKIINCTFIMNKRTALQALDSTLYFRGHVIFSGNNGTLGGALILQGGSTFYLMPHTHVQIINNHVKRGGGIYVEDETVGVICPCFFQLMDLHYTYSDIDSVIILENNTADEAGSALYGGEIDHCYLHTTSQQIMYSSIVSSIIFKVLDLPSFVSQISSNPFALHLCNSSDSFARTEIHSSEIHVHISHVYPGQILNVPVALHGQRYGSVPGIVHAHLLKILKMHILLHYKKLKKSVIYVKVYHTLSSPLHHMNLYC